MLNTPVTRGYEISIYSVYSPIFWFLFFFTLVLGIGLSIHFIVGGVRLWRYSLLTILIADTVILFLPTIRDYEFCAGGGWDIFAHLAWSKYVLNTGHIMGGDHYPAMHILVATLDHLSLFNSAVLAAIISFIFFILYVLSLFVLGRAVFKDDRAAALLAICGSPLLFSFGHHAFYPFLFALFLFPLIFYIMRKIESSGNRGAYYVCFIALSLFIVFCHPLVTLILLLILGALYGYSQISNKGQLGFSCRFDILNMAAIVGVTFVFWYIHFKSILRMGESVISALLGVSDKETILIHNLDLIDQTGASLLRIAEVFIKVYGPMTVYFAIALLITIHLTKGLLTKRKYADEMVYVTFFLLSIGFGVALTLGYFIVFELIRATSFAVIMATIVCGIGFYILLKSAETSNRKRAFTTVTVVVLCLVSIFSVFGVYNSPWTASVSPHMTKMETSGLDWFLVKQDESTPTYPIGSSWRTYPTYFQELHKITVQKPLVISNAIPTHFGYNQNRYLSQSISGSKKGNSYVITNGLIKQSFALPEEVRSVKGRFLQEDFSRLNQDTTVNKLYVNREWELWMVQGA